MESHNRFHAIDRQRARGGDGAVSGFENQCSWFRIVQIKCCNVFQSDQGFDIKLQAWTDTQLVGRACIPIVLGLQVCAQDGIQFEIGVRLRDKLNGLREGW